MSRYDRIMEFAEIHRNARHQAGKSQEYVAAELNVTKKTISNWENGISFPDFFQSIEFFKVLNVNPFPLYLKLIYADEFKAHENDAKTDEAFRSLCNSMTDTSKKMLLFLFCGQHGSDPLMLLHLFTAYMHLPIQQRVLIATMIEHTFEMESALAELNCPDAVMPDIEALKDVTGQARVSAIQHEYGYGITQK